jgi:hypothetical protein
MEKILHITAAVIIQIENLISIAERAAKETPDADYAGWIKKQIRGSREMLQAGNNYHHSSQLDSRKS